MCNSLISSILEAHRPHSLHRSATVTSPANRLHAHSLSRYLQAYKKKQRQNKKRHLPHDNYNTPRQLFRREEKRESKKNVPFFLLSLFILL